MVHGGPHGVSGTIGAFVPFASVTEESVQMPEKSSRKQVAGIKKDAQGQFAKGLDKSDNNGVSSARPRVITGVDDATTGRIPGTTKRPAGSNEKIPPKKR
jgi:hypothetical protein